MSEAFSFPLLPDVPEIQPGDVAERDGLVLRLWGWRGGHRRCLSGSVAAPVDTHARFIGPTSRDNLWNLVAA